VRPGVRPYALALILLSAPIAARGAAAPDASNGSGLALARHVISGGGGSSSGGAFTIRGTIGQADADPLQPATGGVFGITGGFWSGIGAAAAPTDLIFADGFEPAP